MACNDRGDRMSSVPISPDGAGDSEDSGFYCASFRFREDEV
jgi:hypothetical protein